MFEQDYIMRLIKEMVRAMLKLLFNIDTDSPTKELLEESEEKQTLERLLDMVDEGRIDEAENIIYETANGSDYKKLKMALLFYAYLNEKPDKFLKENDFSRDEVKQGIRELAFRYGLDSIVDIMEREDEL